MNQFIAFALLIYKRLHPCFEIPFWEMNDDNDNYSLKFRAFPLRSLRLHGG